MPDVYTTEWYEAVRDAMNASAADLPDLPDGSFVVAIEIVGDGISPYVGTEGRRFLVRIDAGRCSWWRETLDRAEERREAGGPVDYRFTGPATVFDELAAGIGDPIDAALRGIINVRGDVRFLLRHADHVKALLDAYTTRVATTWPRGRPPYDGSPGGSQGVLPGAKGESASA